MRNISNCQFSLRIHYLPLVGAGGGDDAAVDHHGRGGGKPEQCYYKVPKRDLITGLQIAAGLKHGPDLVAEMAAMRVKVGGEGQEQYGAWQEGTHDDLVFAVALGCWAARKMYPQAPACRGGAVSPAERHQGVQRRLDAAHTRFQAAGRLARGGAFSETRK